jgi:hypothetical protein
VTAGWVEESKSARTHHRELVTWVRLTADRAKKSSVDQICYLESRECFDTSRLRMWLGASLTTLEKHSSRITRRPPVDHSTLLLELSRATIVYGEKNVYVRFKAEDGSGISNFNDK